MKCFQSMCWICIKNRFYSVCQ